MMIIRDTGATLRSYAPEVRTDITAASMINRAGFYFPGPDAVPLAEQVESAPITIIGTAEREYGGLGIPASDIPNQPALVRDRIESILINTIDPYFVPLPANERLSGCQPAGRLGASYVTELRPGGAALKSKQPATLRIWRFSDSPSNTVGTLQPGKPALLTLPDDKNPTPWKLISDRPFAACDVPKL